MIRKIILVIFIAFVSSLLLEVLLSIAFTIKDRHLQPLDARDFPYVYFLLNEGEYSNEHGFKTTKKQVKDPGSYRIILSGGSVARSSGKLENSITSRLESELNQTLNSDAIEVVNAGMSGYVIQQEFLLIQMILQHYKPDMIISLSGFNDVYTNLRNNFDNSYNVGLPHNWRNFKVLEFNKDKRSILWRLKAIYKNTYRIIEYFKLQKSTNVPDPDYDAIAEVYWQTVEDVSDLCRSKGIRYFHFIQPARDYRSDKDAFIFGDERLNILYSSIEEKAENYDYAFSLSGIFKNQTELYTDYCHVNPQGNKVFAHEMTEILKPLIRHDEIYFRISESKSGKEGTAE